MTKNIFDYSTFKSQKNSLEMTILENSVRYESPDILTLPILSLSKTSSMVVLASSSAQCPDEPAWISFLNYKIH